MKFDWPIQSIHKPNRPRITEREPWKTDKVPEAKTETRFHGSGSGIGAERQRGGEIVDERYRKDFYKNVSVPGSKDSFNEPLAKAVRVSDFLELGELFAKDALERSESCGGHFREESQTKEGEALRDDKNFTFVSAWENKGEPSEAVLHKENLIYENIELKTRSYK